MSDVLWLLDRLNDRAAGFLRVDLLLCFFLFQTLPYNMLVSVRCVLWSCGSVAPPQTTPTTNHRFLCVVFSAQASVLCA